MEQSKIHNRKSKIEYSPRTVSPLTASPLDLSSPHRVTPRPVLPSPRLPSPNPPNGRENDYCLVDECQLNMFILSNHNFPA
ncbi:MAG TPA: hypothetical protein VK203_05495 [Nostocaceae cyanobacterium]|nr:hypothetical protein [Nostocaceae cyanobacterium]